MGGMDPFAAADKMTKNISPPQKRFNFFMRKEDGGERGGGSEDPFDHERPVVQRAVP